MSDFRIKYHLTGASGVVYWKVQVRKWWGWKTLRAWLRADEASSSRDQIKKLVEAGWVL